jgi:TonB family protein
MTREAGPASIIMFSHLSFSMKPALGFPGSAVDSMNTTVPDPKFLVQLDPWLKVFLRNFADLFRRKGALGISSSEGIFWPDVFVGSGLPWSKFLQSAFVHVAAIALVWGAARYWPQPRLLDRLTLSKDEVISYSPSEYLPPLDTGDPQARQPEKGEPEYAPQPIISVPPEADNPTQTIVTPPDVKLLRDVPLPNIVSWTQMPGPVPRTARSAAEMRLPNSTIPIVAPPPDVTNAMSQTRSSLQPAAVAPPPDLYVANARSLRGPQEAVVAPAPSVDLSVARKLGDMNIGHSDVIAPAPHLPLAEQRAFSRGGTATLAGGSAVVPPPPTIGGSGASTRGSGQLIALSIHPAAINGSIDPPVGNRRGTFSATPQGKRGAPGTPEIAKGTDHGGSGTGPDRHASGLPAGLHVGAGPAGEKSPVAGEGGGTGTDGNSSAQKREDEERVIAKSTPPHVSSDSWSRPATEISATSATDLDKKVFGHRRFYSMTLNMPNLNSVGGSWVIRFAELQNSHEKGDLAAPVAVQKVDPAYPLELMRRNVQGTVTLYAVIRSDGSVGDVRVLQGVDDRLDAYAKAALTHWRFEPATKNGNAVDLEAVVAIPFRASRTKSGF